jgi:hypothetical protein
MVRIDWAQICEMAFLDDCDRLCMIGVMTRFAAPALPIAMRQLMVVVRVADMQKSERFSIGVSLVTPSGVSMTPPRHEDSFDIAITAEYIFITLRDVPLAEEGIHRFAVAVGEGSPGFIDVPVRLVPKTAQAGCKSHGEPGEAFAQSPWVSGRGIN